jgi:hypothetical protein
MAAAAKRGLELHEAGRSGGGLKPETVARAKRIAARESLTEAHVREMRGWFRRHKVDRRPGWGDRGKETPGYTAWMLWGGDSGWAWSEVKAARLDRDDAAEVRGRMGSPRAPKKNKKSKARPGRPAKVGPSAGCGTGSGGFKTGNNCAKEDGIPRKPFSMGGALKQGPKGELQAVKAQIAVKQAKAAIKQQKQQAKDKQTSLAAKKSKAAIRKKEKEGKAAEAQKQTDAAAAAKKKAMLQKIRVKKANEKIQVTEKDFGLAPAPPPMFGRRDNLPQNPGETVVEWKTRTVKKDLEKFHAETDKLEKQYNNAIADQNDKALQAERDHMAAAEKYRNALLSNDKNQASISLRESTDLRGVIEASKKEAKRLEKEMAEQHHAMVAKFTHAHGGGPAQTIDTSAMPPPAKAIGVSNADEKAGIVAVNEARAWLNKIVPKSRYSEIPLNKVHLTRAEGGGSHAGQTKEILVGVKGISTGGLPEDLVKKTTIHEYGHAIEDGSPDTMRALAEDYWKRVDSYRASNPGGIKYFKHSQCSYYEAPAPIDSRSRPGENGESLLGYSRRYSDFGYDAANRGANPSPRKAGGTEAFSTGIEHLYRNPSEFRKKARSHYDLTLLVLAGLI